MSFKYTILVFAAAASLAAAFTSNVRMGRSSLKLRSDTGSEQEVKDLNLEEMFEVFEEADKIPDKAVAQPAMSKFDPTKEIGSSAPMGFFDPASYTLNIKQDQYALYQEAELKHGRVAMIAFLGIVFGENFNPFFDSMITGPAIYQFQQADAIFPMFWVGVTWLIAMLEGQTIIDAWQPIEETMMEPLGVAKLRKGHVPGDYKFDPLNLKPKSPEGFKTMRTKELNNGRLAMIAVGWYSEKKTLF